MGCIVIFFTASVNAQILSPVSQLEGTISSDAKVFFVGRTSISGVFQGYQINSLSDGYLSKEINAFPLFGSSTFESIDSVMIVDMQNIENQSLENITTMDEDIISRFSNVDIIAEEGPFIFGTDDGNTELQSELDFAVSTILSFEVIQGNSVPFLIVLATSPIKTQHNGQLSVLMQLSDNNSIIIEDSAGNVIWNNDTTDKLFLINDTSFSVTQDSPMYLFPLFSQEDQNSIKLSITPASSEFMDISQLFDEIASSVSSFGDMDISDFSDNIQGFDTFISTASAIVNGAMIFAETDDTFIVDNSPQSFSGFGFARGNKFDITVSSESQTLGVDGEYKLIFLGDHLYNSQAKESENGIAFPFPLVIVWVLAVCLYFFFRFYLKKDIDEELDEKIKKYALIFHIAALIVAFILMDREISFQFGVSAIDSILGQGLSLILVVFIVVELIMWVLGFILLAFPIRMITNSILQLFGIRKGGKGIGKGVGAFFIWIFCVLYVKLIVNLIFLIMNPNNLFPMG